MPRLDSLLRLLVLGGVGLLTVWILQKIGIQQRQRALVPENSSSQTIVPGVYRSSESQARGTESPADGGSDSETLGNLVKGERRRAEAEAQPLYTQSLEYERKAEAAVEAGYWDEATLLMEKALVIQQEINRRYFGIPEVNALRAEHLATKHSTLTSGKLHSEVATMITQTEEAFNQGRYRKALELVANARSKQQLLKKSFPKSRYAAPSHLDAMEKRVLKALIHERFESLSKDYSALRRELRDKKADSAREKIKPLARMVAAFRRDFPQSTLVDSTLSAEIDAFMQIEERLETLYILLEGQWIPLPGDSDTLLLRTEVHQELFSQVMQGNPSRNRGAAFPVDSVTWDETQTFCQILSAALQQTIRLPTEHELRAAISAGGETTRVDDTACWHRGNSQRRTQPVGQRQPNPRGWYDLIGNVAEWVQSVDTEPGTTDRLVAGGSAEDSLDTLQAIPFRAMPHKRRNRWIGFRIVMEPAR